MNARKAGWMITAALVMLYVVAGYLGARSAEAAEVTITVVAGFLAASISEGML